MELSEIESAAQFEETYRRAHRLVDEGIILITQGEEQEVCISEI